MAIKDAKQVVLVGDQMKLGPNYMGEAPTNDSMFARLINGNYPNIQILTQQFRMHYYIMRIPNMLFYNNSISSRYKSLLNDNIFLNK